MASKEKRVIGQEVVQQRRPGLDATAQGQRRDRPPQERRQVPQQPCCHEEHRQGLEEAEHVVRKEKLPDVELEQLSRPGMAGPVMPR